MAFQHVIMVILLYLLLAVEANVIGIDFGSELIKVSLIKPGKKLVLVENEQSKRSTPLTFAVYDGDRLFSYKAQTELTKHPEISVSVIKELLGKKFNDPLATAFLQQKYQTVNRKSSEFGGFSYEIGENSFEVEEIAGMVLEYIQQMTTTFSGTNIKDCAVTVPGSFTRSQKLSLMTAVEISGLNLLGIINENSAGLLYYALDRVDDDTDHVVVIYNVGVSYVQITVATIWGYSENGKYKTFIEVLGHESVENLGGSVLDYKLTQQVLSFSTEKYSQTEIPSAKVVSRILREVNLCKKTLSANKVCHLRIENYHNSETLTYELTRDHLNSILKTYSSLFTDPLSRLLTRLNISKNEVHSYELIGGVSKIPFIDDLLESSFNVKFSTHLDPNEAMAQGAALLAAKDSVTVTLKPISLQDVTSCDYFIRSNDKEILVFGVGSKFSSKASIQIDLAANDTFVLYESCPNAKSDYYNYSLDSFGVLTLEFVLDKNGLVFLAKAVDQDQNKVPSSVVDISSPSQPSHEQVVEIKKKIKQFAVKESNAKKLAQMKNELESAVYFIKERVEEEDFIKVTSEEEREGFVDFAKELVDWMESDDFLLADSSELEHKLKDVRSKLVVALEREQEYKIRPKLIEEARKYFGKLEEFMVQVTETATWLTKEQIGEGWEAINSAKKWLEDSIEAQNALESWQPPVLTSKQFDEKFTVIKNKLEKLAYSKPTDK